MMAPPSLWIQPPSPSYEMIESQSTQQDLSQTDSNLNARPKENRQMRQKRLNDVLGPSKKYPYVRTLNYYERVSFQFWRRPFRWSSELEVIGRRELGFLLNFEKQFLLFLKTQIPQKAPDFTQWSFSHVVSDKSNVVKKLYTTWQMSHLTSQTTLPRHPRQSEMRFFGGVGYLWHGLDPIDDTMLVEHAMFGEFLYSPIGRQYLFDEKTVQAKWLLDQGLGIAAGFTLYFHRLIGFGFKIGLELTNTRSVLSVLFRISGYGLTP